MRKAQSDRPRQEMRLRADYPDPLGWFGPTPWLGMTSTAWREGIKWVELWQREVQRVWGMAPMMGGGFAPLMRSGFGPMMPMMPEGDGERPEGERRRVSDMPWVPRLEAQVIPLRRNTDPPGGEATRFSMRVPLPWTDGSSNIVSIETILGMGEPGERERSAEEHDAPKSPGEKRG